MNVAARLREAIAARRARAQAFCHWCDRPLLDVQPVVFGGARYCSEECAGEDSLSRLS